MTTNTISKEEEKIQWDNLTSSKQKKIVKLEKQINSGEYDKKSIEKMKQVVTKLLEK